MTVLLPNLLTGLRLVAMPAVVWFVLADDGANGWGRWWALFIFLLSPLAYVYLFVHTDKGRWPFKLVCAFGLLSPALVGLGGAWRFYSWFHAVIQARGGHV